jgi:hypothetical protein
MAGIIGKKLGMTQIFEETGVVVPVTVVEAGPVPGRAGSHAGARRLRGRAARLRRAEGSPREQGGDGPRLKAGLAAAPAILREFDVAEGDAPEVGAT